MKMRVLGATCLALVLPLFAAAGSPEPLPEEVLTERLAGLGRVWGTIKFFHPRLAYDASDWDRAVLETIPRVESAGSAAELGQALEHLVSFLDDPRASVWVEGAVEDEPAGEAPAAESPQVRHLDGDVKHVVLTDWNAVNGDTLGALIDECEGAAGIILDLRNRSRASHRRLTRALDAELPRLLGRDVVLSTRRSRVHSGYPPQQGGSSGGYYAGLLTREHPVLRAAADAVPRNVPIALVLNGDSSGLEAYAGGLQAAGLATVVQEGDDAPLEGVRVQWESVTDSAGVAVRTEETLNPDGSLGFRADLIVAAPDGPESDPALEMAVRAVTGLKMERVHRRAAPGARELRDETYEALDPTPRAHRLLGLFRFWNTIRYFFPYDDLLDEPWDGTLTEFLPAFAGAGSQEDYALVARRLAARMQDTHAGVSGGAADGLLGTHDPKIVVSSVEGRWVVRSVLDDDVAGKIAPGDLIVSVDGEAATDRAARLAPLCAASTPQALRWRIGRALLGGEPDTEADLVVEKPDGSHRNVRVRRTHKPWEVRDLAAETRGPIVRVLPENIGYIDLDRLQRGGSTEALKEVEGTNGLIFDMRGYPNSTVWELGPRFASDAVTAARFSRPFLLDPKEMDQITYGFEQRVRPGRPWDYGHPIVVLIDENAISQAEHTCLHLEAVLGDRVTFVGGPTNGANGDVTRFPLPGGLWVHFTGHDVRHGDGRQLQRLGIQPDIPVEPTIRGVRAGEDEVLAAAVRFLQGN